VRLSGEQPSQFPQVKRVFSPNFSQTESIGRSVDWRFKEFRQPGQKVNDLFTVMTEDSALRLQAAPSCHLPYTRASQNPLFLRDTPAIEGRRAAEAQIIPGTG
jgi:hypothetical protein